MMKQLRINKSLTNRKEESVDKYLTEISRIPMISIDDEVLLAQAIRDGGLRGAEAKDQLVKANLRFVVSVAKMYQNMGTPLADLINEGNMGLITAAERFDEKRGFKFISYAVWWVRQAILTAVSAQHPVDSDTPFVDTVASEKKSDERMDRDSMLKDIQTVLNRLLSEQERTILCRTLGIGCGEESLGAVGIDLGLSRERVRQIKEKAIRKIRKSEDKQILAQYLG